MVPGRKSLFRAGFRPDSNRESLNIDTPAGLGRIVELSGLESGRNPARRPQGLLPRLISLGFLPVFLRILGSEEYPFMCHAFIGQDFSGGDFRF